jgi:hypothetical protein
LLFSNDGGFDNGGGKDDRGGGKKPIPNEPPYTAFVGNLPDGIVQGDVEIMFKPLKVGDIKLSTAIQCLCIFGFKDINLSIKITLSFKLLFDFPAPKDSKYSIGTRQRN